MLASPSGQEAMLKAADIAAKHHVKSALTFSDGFIVDTFGGPLGELVGRVDLVFANFSEASKFTGTDKGRDHQKDQSRGPSSSCNSRW